MAQQWTRQALAVAVAGAIGFAYVQVSEAPTAPTPPRPSVSAMMTHVKTDLQWFRTEIPRDPTWWKGAYALSAENLRVLDAVLSGPSTTP